MPLPFRTRTFLQGLATGALQAGEVKSGARANAAAGDGRTVAAKELTKIRGNLTNPRKSQLSLATKWGFEPSYFSKLLSGAAPAGATVVARTSLSIPPEQACRLIENYLLDIADQIDFERKRLAKDVKSLESQFVATISIHAARKPSLGSVPDREVSDPTANRSA